MNKHIVAISCVVSWLMFLLFGVSARGSDEVAVIARHPTAQLEIAHSNPKLTSEFFEIDIDGSALRIQDGQTKVLTHFSQNLLNRLQIQIDGVNLADLVDSTPAAPHCTGETSKEYRVFKSDGSGVVIGRVQNCHSWELPNEEGQLVREMLDALEGVSESARGWASPLFGLWGTPGAILDAGSSGISIQMACAAANIPGAVTLDKSGHFEADGTFTQLGGVFPPGGFHGVPAHFSGQLRGDELEMSVILPQSVLHFVFRLGQTNHFAHCA